MLHRRVRPYLLALLVAATAGQAADLPRPISRAFGAAGIPVGGYAVVVRAAGATRPIVAHQATKPMTPASVMKLVTTLAALETLGRDYRWKTEAYLGGPLDADGTLHGDLILKGYGDPKITVEQWQSFIAQLRAAGLHRIDGDLVLDRSWFAVPPYDPAAFDGEPLKPYNVGPDALLVSFKSVRFLFTPNVTAGAAAPPAAVGVTVDPPLPNIALGANVVADGVGRCGDWRQAVGGTFIDQGRTAAAKFDGRFPLDCGERDWYVSLLDHPHYVQGIFTWAFTAAGGDFAGGVRNGRAPVNAKPFATLQSPPLYDVMRDINKLSNNVMAAQLFLTLGAINGPPGTPEKARAAIARWLATQKLRMPELEIANGSGLSRTDRISAQSLAALLDAADRSPVREEFASSLAVAAMDGTVQRRFVNGDVAGQALLKTGTLDGVRALAGYVIDAEGRRWIVAVIVNHPRAAVAQPALDAVVDWVYHDAGKLRTERAQP
ncbi:MAG: D-alanyl-D-alanine carboxypeptidase/D-alanyl-D-alanine-endopeptidase [Proteobacteria bacterium]|nr:D-alanyl-D-alanine carboxypeptidase/D-alanyl-D-alanine-endopeptidase [Pseudomonadota bacterium]